MDELVSILEKYKIDHEIMKHTKQINSAQEGAEYFNIHVGQTAPTLILKTDKGYYTLIISGDYGRVNLELIKDLLQVQQINLAKPKEVEQVTGCKVGSVSLINQGIPTIIDRDLYRFQFVYGGTGIPNSTLKIKPKDIENLNEVIAYIR